MFDSTEFGSVTVKGKKYDHDVIVNYKGEVRKGWLQTRHVIGEKDFLDLLKEKPEIIVIGNGQDSCLEISENVFKLAKNKGVEVVSLATPEAIEKFNQLYESGKKIVTYIHVTC